MFFVAAILVEDTVYPIIKLKRNNRNNGLKLALIVTLIMGMVSVPEYSYLSMWMMLGIAYNSVSYQKAHLQSLL